MLSHSTRFGRWSAPDPTGRLTPAEQEIARALAWLIDLRWLAGIGVFFATVLATDALGMPLPARGLRLVGAGVLLYNAALHLTRGWIDRQPRPSPAAYQCHARAQMILDWVAMAALVALSGGIESPVVVFFLFHITIASLLLPPQGRGWIYVSLAPALVGGVACLEYFGVLPHVHLFEPSRHRDARYVGTTWFFFTCACYLLEYFSASISARVRRRESEITGLYESVRDTASLMDLDEVLRRLAEACTRVLGCKAAAIRLLDQPRGRLEPVASSGLSQAYIDKGPIDVAQAAIDQEVLAGGTVLVADMQHDPRIRFPAEARAEGLYSMLSAPLAGKAGAVGVLRAFGGKGHRFTGRDAAFLAALGAHGAVAIENAEAHRLLRRLEEDKARFVSTVTHDLRSPIGVTRTLLAVLAQGHAGRLTPQQEDLAGRALRRLTFLQTLVDDLIDLATARAELPADVNRRPLAVGDAVRDVCARLDDTARDKGIGLHCHVPIEPVIVWANPVELDLVLANLVANAVKYTLRGEVRVDVDRQNGRARIVIADSGIGIPESAREHLFEQFFRAGNARALDERGTGLGLAIAKAIADRYGATIEVASTEGEGTTVTLLMPLAAEAPPG